MRYLALVVLLVALVSAGNCATDVWKVGTVHGLFQYEIGQDGTELLFFEQPRNTSGWYWLNNNGSPFGTLATGGFGPNGWRDGSRTFAVSGAAAGQRLCDVKLTYTYYNPWGYCTMNFFMTDGRGRYGIFSPASGGIAGIKQETVNGDWTTITLDFTDPSISDALSVAVYEHNGLKAVYGEPYTTFTWGEIKNYTIAGMYDYQRSPHYGWEAWADVFGEINSSWTPIVIRNATTSGNPPAINDVVESGYLAKEFVITEAGMKAAWGTRMLDGKKVKDIEGHVIRLDDTSRFTAGSGPAVAPYFNIWVTDGNGKFAVIGNEPSNPEWTANPGSSRNFDWDMLKTKVAKAYENTDKTWLPNNGVGLTFNDLAEYTILPPTPDQLSAGWAGLGPGAPRELGTNKAYGFNWVLGDTLANYVSGDPGYILAQPDIRKDAPALVNGYGVALIWGDTVGNDTYATQKRWIKEPVITFGGTDYEGTFEDSPVPNLLYLTPTTTYVKPSQTAVLGLYQANLDTPVAGYQGFMSFDAGLLSISAGDIVPTATPYPLVIWKAVSSPNIDLAAGVAVGDPPTSVDAQLATLTFTAGLNEGTTKVTFRESTPPTRFVDDQGNEVRTAAVESGDIVIDGTPPTITCPANIEVSTDSGKCYATVTDLGTPVTGDNLSGVDTVTNNAPTNNQYAKGTNIVTWTVTDKAGNSAQCQQTVTVNDTEKPVVTKGTIASCYATEAAAEAAARAATTATDNCTPTDDLVFTASTVGDCSATITVRVTDLDSNYDEVTYDTRIDGTPPVVTCPSDITVHAAPGSSSAVVTWSASADDNCDGTLTPTCTPASGSTFPVGTTPVTCEATDTCGNRGQCTFSVTVLDTNEAVITVELEGVTASFTREIEFKFGGDGSGTQTATVYANVPFTAGTGTVTVEIPAGVNWTCVTAKDRQHTLTSKTSLGVSGGQYTASFTGVDKLIGGDLTNDDLVDILDFGVLVGQAGDKYDGPYTWPARDADITGDGAVWTEDYTYISLNFLDRGDLACGGAPLTPASIELTSNDKSKPGKSKPGTIEPQPQSSVTIQELAKIVGMKAAKEADLNGDRIIDTTDMQLFAEKCLGAGGR